MLASSLRALGDAGADVAFGGALLVGRRRAGVGGSGDRLAALEREVLLTQRLELRMLWMQEAQKGIGIVCFRRRLDHLARLQQRQLTVKRPAERSGIGAAAARVPRVFENGMANGDLRVGTGAVGGRGCSHRLQWEGRSLQAPIVGAADFADDSLACRREAGRADPDRRVLARRIESDQRCPILAVGGAGCSVVRRQPLG
jgi:hypothetical protein